MQSPFRPAVVIMAILVFSLFLSGCQSLSSQQRSALGTTVGSVAGALAGSQIGGGKGQVVAMAVGAALGGYVGNRFANHLNQQEQESLAQTTQEALRADESRAGAVDWRSGQRTDVGGQVYYGKTVSAHDNQAGDYLSDVRGKTISAQERAKLASLDEGTSCRPTRTSLSVEERGVADGVIWCRTPKGDYKPLDAIAA
ncbi:glycine zipper 2TM domain-containing protein [Halomonas garicola]|uniref:glycine zipper 2TM domain-containing protein n=1 Tax=Halomonas garicola TaxID=1690008 RepID=UPI0028999C5C|nr:glycine zipper 2TM domain-containing protein [Halomonas garicola]